MTTIGWVMLFYYIAMTVMTSRVARTTMDNVVTLFMYTPAIILAISAIMWG